MDSISLYEKREQLQRVLRSRHFARAKKKSRFLEFVCEQTFSGNADNLNEYLIGVEIYERDPGFNPQNDAIVRVQAHEIRKSLKEYYGDEGKDDFWRIDLPPGHYVPAFEKASDYQHSNAEEETRRPQSSRGLRRAVVALVLTCVVLAALLIRLWYVPRNPRALPTTGGFRESMAWFWGPFLPPAGRPLIVIPNHPLLRAAHEGDPPSTLNRSYRIPKESLHEFHDTIHYRELEGFFFVPSTTDFTAVGETLGILNLFELFASVGQSVRLKPSRRVDFEEVKSGNTILLGGNQSWSGRIFIYPEGFRFRAGVIENKTPLPGELAVYRPEFDPVTNSLRKDYAVVMMLPNERREHRVLLIYGIYTQGSQAAIEYVTSEERLQELRPELLTLSPDRESIPPYFQVLLQTTVEDYVPGKASFVAARLIPAE